MDAVQGAPGAKATQNGAITVAIVGRLSPWKGQDIFLDAFAKAFPGGEERALIVGSAMFGEDTFERQLRAQADRLGIADRVSFVGFARDVFGLLAEVDVLVHASTVPEPFGQVIIEGMAAGVPVIASAAGGPLEIVTHGVNGVLVAPGDAEALAAWLVQLAASPQLRAELAAQGRVRALDFAPERIAGALAAVYGRVAL
jgi:glycosyltransferase involved in cell wall biosynthesis